MEYCVPGPFGQNKKKKKRRKSKQNIGKWTDDRKRKLRRMLYTLLAQP